MLKNIDRWIGSYIVQKIKRSFEWKPLPTPAHVIFCCVDHYEPDWNKADLGLQLQRVQRWVDRYPGLAKKHRDSNNIHPKYTFFYPAECYQKETMSLLEKICRQGIGEVEVHLHHDNDTEEGLRAKLEQAKKDFLSHGFLGKRNLSGQPRFAFIHGNWALNNSRCDKKYCGVNNEIAVLKDAGCYADFTFPSAPSETQTAKINSIYYARSSKFKPKGHNSGGDAGGKQSPRGDLLLVQGPLALNWRKRKKGVIPRIENSEISGLNPPTPDRVDLWVDQRISIRNKPDWIFVKVYAHGAIEKNAETLLGEPMDKMFTYLETNYNDGKKYQLHYVSAREMYNIIKAAEAGETGNPNQYRDYMVGSNMS